MTQLFTAARAWVLDVSFQEDDLRGCQGYSAENLSVIRQMGLVMILSQFPSLPYPLTTLHR